MKKTPLHTHRFVEEYDDDIGFGFNRQIDENTIVVYLQKFSDDTLMENLLGKLNDTELEEIFNLVTRLLKKHLTGEEYHRLFLKQEHKRSEC
jgi:hypothetical protein